MPFCAFLGAKGESVLFRKVRLRFTCLWVSREGFERTWASNSYSRTRDSIINYSDERMRPRVKGSFLNARCGLTDSPPCPPTTPPTLLRPPPTFLTQARRTSRPRDCRMYMYEFAPDQILRRSGGAPGASSSCFFFLPGLKLWVTSEFMHSKMLGRKLRENLSALDIFQYSPRRFYQQCASSHLLIFLKWW